MVKDGIEEAMEKGNGETSLFSLYQKLILDHAQLWVVLDKEEIVATATTEIINYESYSTLHIITTTGKGWDEYSYLHNELEEFAKHKGCRETQIWGRKGWEKKLDKLTGKNGKKYKHTYSVFSMEV